MINTDKLIATCDTMKEFQFVDSIVVDEPDISYFEFRESWKPRIKLDVLYFSVESDVEKKDYDEISRWHCDFIENRRSPNARELILYFFQSNLGW